MRTAIRKDVMDAVKGLGVSILRWPGGNFASGYNWKDGIGPKDQRPARPELAWNDVETNRFGTDEFLRYCRDDRNRALHLHQPRPRHDRRRARLGRVHQRVAKHTYWADQRRKNGREQPYNVKYWALGNEIDGPWQLGHKNAEEYAKFALEAAKAMRGIDPSNQAGRQRLEQLRRRLDGLEPHGAADAAQPVDYIALHTYINNRDERLRALSGGWQQTIERYIETTRGADPRGADRQPNPRPIYIAYDEWNVWYRTGNRREAGGDLQLRGRAGDGHVLQYLLPPRRRRQDGEPGADGERHRADHDEQEGLFLQPIYFPIAEYGRQRGNTALDVWVSSPTYKIQNRPQRVDVSRRVGDLDAEDRARSSSTC